MTLDEAINAVRQKMTAGEIDSGAFGALVDEVQACAQAREIAARNVMLALLAKNIDPAMACLASFAMGVQVGILMGQANAEAASLQKMFDKEEGGI